MKYLPLSISVGVLCFVLMAWDANIGYLVPPAVFIGWSSFFACGASAKTVPVGLIPSIFGQLLAFATVSVFLATGAGPMVLAGLVAVMGFAMTIVMNIKALSLAACTFLGGAAYFTVMGLSGLQSQIEILICTLVSILVGFVFGIVCVVSAGLFAKKEKTETT